MSPTADTLGHIVDGGDVICIHRMPESKAIGKERCSEEHGIVVEG
jgi:hypothetical protein